MAKKKEHVESAAPVSTTDVPDTGLLNNPPAPVQTSDQIVIGDIDFNELLELERQRNATEDQLNKISGAVFRLQADQKAYHEHEKNLAASLELKRKELVKRYKIDDARKWQIDLKSRVVIYQS